MKVQAVIGAAYGDEGKGLITDALSRAHTLVVRYNGGAQAGHTVVLPDDRRHVFSHIGSGSFRGAGTFLSRYFLVNPRVYLQELGKLARLSCTPKVLVSPHACVCTPYDVAINQLLENARGEMRHGSCGFGINETVTRSEAGFQITVDHLRRASLPDQLETIRDHWVPARCKVLGIPVPDAVWSTQATAQFLEDCHVFLEHVAVVDDESALNAADHLLFEGAQGLRLDELSEDFPHVTRSRTGIVNVLKLLHEARLDVTVDAIYVTRAYTTRHGAGPLPLERPSHPYGWLGDETNVTNLYQGSFRYGLLQVDSLCDAIKRDTWLNMVTPIQVLRSVAVTCLDQVPREVGDHLMALIDRTIPVSYRAHGPTREHVQMLDFARV